MTKERWQVLFEAWKSSGLSQEKFCQKERINYHTFVYWRTKQNASKKKSSGPSFAEAKLTNPHTTASRISLASGVQLIIPATTQKEDVLSVLKAVGIV